MNTEYAGIPVPNGSDADDVPVDLASGFGYIDTMLNLRATDTADRDTRYGDAPAGVIVVLDDESVWIKTSPSSPAWEPLRYDTGWVTSGFVAQAGFDVVYAAGRVVNNVYCEVVGQCTRSGSDLVAGDTGVHSGNVGGDPSIVQVPSSFRPTYPRALAISGNFGTWGGRLNTDGHVRVLDGPPGASLETDSALYWHCTFLRG